MWLSKKKYNKMQEALDLSYKAFKVLQKENHRMEEQIEQMKLELLYHLKNTKQSPLLNLIDEPAEVYDKIVKTPIKQKGGKWYV